LARWHTAVLREHRLDLFRLPFVERAHELLVERTGVKIRRGRGATHPCEERKRQHGIAVLVTSWLLFDRTIRVHGHVSMNRGGDHKVGSRGHPDRYLRDRDLRTARRAPRLRALDSRSCRAKGAGRTARCGRCSPGSRE
jgi:hypothetical protein